MQNKFNLVVNLFVVTRLTNETILASDQYDLTSFENLEDKSIDVKFNGQYYNLEFYEQDPNNNGRWIKNINNVAFKDWYFVTEICEINYQ
jgi:hypothetical protein